MIRTLAAAIASIGLATSPATAATATPKSPAGTLSIVQVEGGGGATPVPEKRGVRGGGIAAAVILAGVAAVAVLLATQDDRADSN